MSELLNNRKTYETPALFDERAVLEGMTIPQLDDLLEEAGYKATHIEQFMHLVNEVKDAKGGNNG